MKKIFFLSVFASAIMLGSCRKAVTEHEDNYPHALVESNTFVISSWIYVPARAAYKGSHFPSQLTTEIIDGGAFMLYWRVDDTWMALPTTIETSAQYSTNIQVDFQPFQVNVWFGDSDLIQGTMPGSLTFKLVTISPMGMAQNPNVNLLDYEEVRQTFALD